MIPNPKKSQKDNDPPPKAPRVIFVWTAQCLGLIASWKYLVVWFFISTWYTLAKIGQALWHWVYHYSLVPFYHFLPEIMMMKYEVAPIFGTRNEYTQIFKYPVRNQDRGEGMSETLATPRRTPPCQHGGWEHQGYERRTETETLVILYALGLSQRLKCRKIPVVLNFMIEFKKQVWTVCECL